MQVLPASLMAKAKARIPALVARRSQHPRPRTAAAGSPCPSAAVNALLSDEIEAENGASGTILA